MARCDQGYLCRVCGEEVEHITESELYLRYVIGEVDHATLHETSECHLQCNPALAQFIDDPNFALTNAVPELYAKAGLDPDYVAKRIEAVSRGYRRLWEIRGNRNRFPRVADYPLDADQ